MRKIPLILTVDARPARTPASHQRRVSAAAHAPSAHARNRASLYTVTRKNPYGATASTSTAARPPRSLPVAIRPRCQSTAAATVPASTETTNPAMAALPPVSGIRARTAIG